MDTSSIAESSDAGKSLDTLRAELQTALDALLRAEAAEDAARAAGPGPDWLPVYQAREAANRAYQRAFLTYRAVFRAHVAQEGK